MVNLKLVKIQEEHYEFVRLLRTHSDNIDGFVERVTITPDQQKAYMEKYKECYYIALSETNQPVGWIGVVDNDIRLCTDPEFKGNGVGKFMLNNIMNIFPNATAKVFLSNIASIRTFLSCGFNHYKTDRDFLYFRKEIYNRPLHNPFKIVQMFEEEVARYTGAPYAVAVDSCTNALFLSLQYYKSKDNSIKEIEIPSKTYLSVPQSILQCGYKIQFNEKRNDWTGIYQLDPFPIYDAAKRFTSNMYISETIMCLSFHIKKHLKIGKGGMILTDNIEAVEFLKKARYEGRSEKMYHEDNIKTIGWNMYMTPQQAAHGLALMQNYPMFVPDLDENNGYRDLREFDLFKKHD